LGVGHTYKNISGEQIYVGGKTGEEMRALHCTVDSTLCENPITSTKGEKKVRVKIIESLSIHIIKKPKMTSYLKSTNHNMKLAHNSYQYNNNNWKIK
jgi:hypothetical protein